MSDEKNIAGIVRPLNESPCFGFPVFKDRFALYMQIGDKSERIVGFEKLNEQPLNMLLTDSYAPVGIGHQVLYGFSFSAKDYIIGTKEEVQYSLSVRKHEL